MAYDSQIRKQEYEYLKHRGLCVDCRKEAMPNSIYCYECWEKSYDRNQKYYAEHKEERKKQLRNNNKKRYAMLKAKGLCTKCGKHKAVPGETLCLSCKVKKKRCKDPRWNNDIDRNDRPKYGLCYICAKPLNKHKKLCDSCHEKAVEKMKKINANPTEGMLAQRERIKRDNDIAFMSNRKNKNNETEKNRAT